MYIHYIYINDMHYPYECVYIWCYIYIYVGKYILSLSHTHHIRHYTNGHLKKHMSCLCV